MATETQDDATQSPEQTSLVDTPPTTVVQDGKTDDTQGSVSLSKALDRVIQEKTGQTPAPAPKPDPKPERTTPAPKPTDDKGTKKPDTPPRDFKKEEPSKDDKKEGDPKINPPVKKQQPEKKDDVDEVTDEEIEEEVKEPHKNQKTAKRIRALYKRWKESDGKAATTTKQLQEKEATLTKIEKELAELKAGKGATDEQIQKEREELMLHRRRYQLENDPEIKERFDNRLAAANESVTEILLRNGVPKETVQLMNQNGGFDAYMRANGQKAKEFLESIDFADAESIRHAVAEKQLIGRAKAEHIRLESSKANQYFEQKRKEEEEAKKNAPDPQREAAALNRVLNDWTENAFKEVEHFHLREVPEGATAEERRQIEAHNKEANELRDVLRTAVNPQNLQDRVDAALAAALAHRMSRQISDQNKKIAELEEQLKSMQEADSTVGGKGSIATGAINGRGNDRKQETQRKGLGAVLDAMEQGSRDEVV